MSHHINPVLSGNLKCVKDYKGKFDLTQSVFVCTASRRYCSGLSCYHIPGGGDYLNILFFNQRKKGCWPEKLSKIHTLDLFLGCLLTRVLVQR